MLEGLFQLLFKYRPAVFAQGDLAFGVAGPLTLGVVAVLLVAAATVYSYRRIAPGARRHLLVLGVLRGSALLVVLVCLFRPMLVLSAPVPQRNFVGVLVDDSRSMQIKERGGRSRADVVRAALSTGDSSILAALRERFQVRLFRFGSSSQRIEQISDLGFNAVETRVSGAIAQARQELDAVPLSGLVVLTDGADNTTDAIDAELASLRAKSIPVFTVGLGAERFDHDVEVERVELPKQVLEGSSFIANVVIRQRGYASQKLPVVVEDDGRVIAREEVEMPPDGATTPVRVPVTVTTPGPRRLRFSVPVQRDELLPQNNQRLALLDVRHRREKVLFVEGEPRSEVAFASRAIAADSNLQLVLLQRTAENKYLRLNVDSASELAGGFPVTRAELFRYRAIVLGSIEASAFTADQLRMLADFVSVRGGGILFLGGRRAFGEGGYGGTPLADIFPTFVDGDAIPDSLTQFHELTVRVTQAGTTHPVTQHAVPSRRSGVTKADTTAIQRVHVTTVNRTTRLKPGAVALLEGSDGSYKQPVLAYQRYGKGLAVAMPIQDSWLWYMDANVAVDDATYRTLWRQLLRWITSETPPQLRVSASVDRVRPGGSVTIRAELADSGFAARNDARLVAHVRAPSGTTRDVPLEWVVDRDGEYQAAFSSEETGLHTVRVTTAAQQGSTAAAPALEDSAYVEVADLEAEFFGSEMRRPLLRRIADETGGKFYTPANMRSLPEDIALSKRGVTVINQLDLWDMPVVLLLLVALLSVEWAYRRRRGLA
ncbi:MAG TPA: hypothetical protein VFT29_10990 [Gemmatimonadaceae bacterium]|nr:hypothetical protein [Gemmatimonadaceae bacterium]